jgi:hypothetical protein
MKICLITFRFLESVSICNLCQSEHLLIDFELLNYTSSITKCCDVQCYGDCKKMEKIWKESVQSKVESFSVERTLLLLFMSMR